MNTMHKIIFTNLIAVMISSGALAINVPEGQYLPANSQTPDTCLAGSFCTGGDYTFDENNSQGATPCSTLEGGAYQNSASGASSSDECYKACENSDVAHATAVTGNNYYGNGIDTCEATSCDDGYQIQRGTLNATGRPELTQIASTAIMTSNGEFRETTVIGNPKGQDYYGLPGNNSGAIDLIGLGLLNIRAYCNTTPGNTDNNTWENPTTYTENSLTDETGTNGANYCYCRVDSYTPTGQAKQNLNTSWVFLNNYGDSQSCKDACMEECLGTSLGYNGNTTSESLYLTLYAPTNLWTMPACIANTIGLTWFNNDTQYGDSTQCTYGDIIELPAQPEKTGYTFTGWTVVQ